MAVQCPRCHRQYDVTLFQFGHVVRCECGARVDLSRGHVASPEAARAEPQAAPREQVESAASSAGWLVLVRHAEAGVGAEGLGERGLRQALALAERLAGERAAALYTSDAAPCRETARPIASTLGVRVQATPLLGGAEPGGAVAVLREAPRRHPGPTILAVTGAAACRAVVRHALGLPAGARGAFRVDAASVHRIEVAAGGWRVALLNDTCHLGPGGGARE